MALTTGHADALECLLRKIGVSDSEFTVDTGPGRVHMYYGGDLSGPAGAGAGANAFTPALGGGAFSSAKTLWSNPAQLMKYDMLLLSCEGSQYASAKMPYVANIKAYADAGGRMFTDHLHFYWLNHGPAPWPMTASYIGVGSDLPNPFVSTIDQSFPKGVAFAQWLVNVGATTAPAAGAPETIQILQGQYSVQATVPPYTQRWIYASQNPNDSAKRPAVEYMTMNTPAELAASMPANQCGRVVFTDLHVVSAAVAGTRTRRTPGLRSRSDVWPPGICRRRRRRSNSCSSTCRRAFSPRACRPFLRSFREVVPRRAKESQQARKGESRHAQPES